MGIGSAPIRTPAHLLAQTGSVGNDPTRSRTDTDTSSLMYSDEDMSQPGAKTLRLKNEMRVRRDESDGSWAGKISSSTISSTLKLLDEEVGAVSYGGNENPYEDVKLSRNKNVYKRFELQDDCSTSVSSWSMCEEDQGRGELFGFEEHKENEPRPRHVGNGNENVDGAYTEKGESTSNLTQVESDPFLGPKELNRSSKSIPKYIVGSAKDKSEETLTRRFNDVQKEGTGASCKRPPLFGGGSKKPSLGRFWETILDSTICDSCCPKYMKRYKPA